jgi:hypothetical protein
MKLPSLSHLATQATRTMLRFPFETAAAITGTVSAILMIRQRYPDDYPFSNWVLTAALGLVMFLSASLCCERFRINGIRKWGIQLVIAGLLAAYYCSLRPDISSAQTIRHFVLLASFHLLISFVAVIPPLSINTFWQFNKSMFLRFLTTALYSMVLFAGLAGALAAIDNLFGIHIKSDYYGWLFVIIAGIFNTLFFLSGIPRQEEIAAEDTSYPKGLRVFTQFVLIPIICIYLVILAAYEIKIVATLNLPYGWVSYLILWYAIAGILCTLLVYPLRNDEEHTWIRTFSKWFYITLVPLVALLFWAILYRISRYGITEERYYVVALAIWLTVIVGYFLISRANNIRIIPVTLCVAGLISAYGPLSASFLSERSQRSRFETLVERSRTDTLSAEERSQMVSILEHMLPNYGVQSLNSVLNHRYDTVDMSGINYWQYKDSIMLYLQVPEIPEFEEQEQRTYDLASPYMINISGYQYYFETYYTDTTYHATELNQLGGVNEPIIWKRNDSGIGIKIGNEKIKINPAEQYKKLRITDFGSPYAYTTYSGIEKMTQRAETSTHKIDVVYSSLEGEVKIDQDTTYTVTRFVARVFIGRK